MVLIVQTLCQRAIVIGALFFALSVQAAELNRPNILLLMAEDMSTRVGAFGDPVARTPNLDTLAEQGVRYPNTFTTAGVCAPSRAAHILGMHQISTGTQHMRTTRGPFGSYKAVPPVHAKAYPELLRAAGYYTFTDTKLDYQFSGPLWNSGPFSIWDAEGIGTSWRDRLDGQPFYGFLNFAVTHESGLFPPLGNWPNSLAHLSSQVMRAVTMPDLDDIPPTDPATVGLPPYYPDTPTVRHDIARHYDNIAMMDRQVGDILQQLEEDGLTESTIVIWTTDHGDGLPRGKRELYDSGIKVPMLIRWPEAFRPAKVVPGSVDERMISFVDLAPTILRLAGVTVPGHLQGRDFVTAPARQYIFASRDRIDEVPDRQRAVRDRQFKYVRSWHPQQEGGHALQYRDNIPMMAELHQLNAAGKLDEDQQRWFEPPGVERLYDLQNDPFELHSVIEDPRYAVTANRLRRALDTWLDTVEDWSERSEVEMLASFQPDGKVPVTGVPSIKLIDSQIAISAPDNASLGYRINDGSWQLYVGPLLASPGLHLEAKAVRYGWQESDISTFNME